MNLLHRIDLLTKLGDYMLSGEEGWVAAVEKAGRENGWFTPEFTDAAIKNIATSFLKKEKL